MNIPFTKVKPKNYFLLWLCFMFCSIQIGLGQKHDFNTIPLINNGGSKVLPKTLTFDNNRFIWYSTNNGLVKVMGDTNILIPINHPDKDVNLHIVNDLLITKNNHIWGAPHSGVYSLNIATGHLFWLTPKHPTTTKPITFTSIKEDSKGTLWLGTSSNYVYSYSPNKKLEAYKVEDSIYVNMGMVHPTINTANMVIEEVLNDGSLIIRQKSIWFKLSKEGSREIINLDKAKRLKSDITSSIISNNGKYFPKNSSGNYIFKEQKFTYKYIKEIDRQIIKVPVPFVTCYSQDYKIRNKEKWDFVSFLGQILTTYKFVNETGKYALKIIEEVDLDNAILSLSIDPDGFIWVQTIDGYGKRSFDNSIFSKYLNDPIDSEKKTSCRGFIENSQGIYVFSHSGIFKLKNNSKKFEKIVITNEIDKTLLSIDFDLYDIYKQNDSIIWGYGFETSLFKINLKTKTFLEIHSPPRLKSSINYFLDVERLNNDTLLVAASFGLFEFNLKTHQFKDVSKIGENFDLTDKYVYDIYINRDKTTLWIAMGLSGLYKKDLISNAVSYFTMTSESLKLVDNAIACFFEDAQKNIWLGTSKGLQKINPTTLSSTSYTKQNGINNDHITGILEEGDNLWFGTFGGLVKLNKKTGFINDYYIEDGIPDNEFNKRSVFRANDGSFFFGGINGLVRFNPKASFVNAPKPKIFLTELEIYDQQTNKMKRFIYNLDSISSFTLPYKHNLGTLKFALNDLNYSNKEIFQYRIKKISDQWITLGNYNTLRLNGLEPNNYILEVKGFSSKGSQSSNILTYTIKVEQIFYKNKLFLALVFLVVLFMSFYWNDIRLKRQKNRFNQKIKISQLETKALLARMNPHFIFNALNSMQSVLMLKGEREANKYIGAFSRLIRYTLDMSNSEYILLKDEINYIKSYINFEQLQLDQDLETCFEIDIDLDLEKIKIPCMLFQPIIENAILHGLKPKMSNRKLKISMKKQGEMIKGTIIDNGIGREASYIRNQNRKNHKSQATAILNERKRIFNALYKTKTIFKIIDLKEGDKALGTKVCLTIPIKTTDKITS